MKTKHSTPKSRGHGEGSSKSNITELSVYIKNPERPHISNLKVHLTAPEKRKEILSKSSRWKEITKLEAKNNNT